MREITAEEASDISRAAIVASVQYADGQITLEEFEERLAILSLAAQGLWYATPEQVRTRISEHRTSASFISACPVPQ